MAVSPREVVERVKIKITEDAEQKTDILDKLKDSDVLGELNTLHTKGIKLINPSDKSGAFRGRNKIYEHLNTMIKNAQKSITLMTTRKGLERKHNSLLAPLKKAAQRGIVIKIAVPNNADKESVNQFSKIAEIRNTKNDARFCIVDNKELLLVMTEDKKVHKDYDCGIWIDASYFVDYFAKLFDNEWKTLR